MGDKTQTAMKLNWILLGLVMLVPGLLKLFSFKPAGVAQMLAGLGFPAASFFAWVLILGEILSGIAILAKWNLKKIVYIPMIILVVATFTAHWANWGNMLVHLALVTNYWLLGLKSK